MEAEGREEMSEGVNVATKRAAAMERTRLWRLANPEKAAALREREKEKARGKPTSPEEKARRAAAVRARRADNPKKFQEAERKRRAENLEKMRAQEKIRRAANPERVKLNARHQYEIHKEKILERNRRYYEANKDAIREQRKIYGEAKKEEAIARARKWRKENPEMARALRSNRKERLRRAIGTYTGDDIKRLIKMQRQKCGGCRVSIKNKFHVDHIMPIALGGTNEPRNLQILCPTCNLRKNAKHPLVWARDNGRLI
jgi:5-methylcytosine-specific restriction endonuclease McrA